MKIGVIGGGVVGSAIARCYLEHCEKVVIWDVDRAKRTTEDPDEPVDNCDLTFICLPEDSISNWFMGRYPRQLEKNYVLKSTVPIGTTRRLAQQYKLTNLVHSPEFLTARCAMTDVQCPAVNIIGVPWIEEQSVDWEPLAHLYDKRFPGVTTQVMDSNESEAVKLFLNSFFAVKVGFFNEVRSLADKLGLDWETVRAGMLADGRIAHAHTQVPGPDGKRGFGGKCLPKDLEMLCLALTENDLRRDITHAASHRNVWDREARP